MKLIQLISPLLAMMMMTVPASAKELADEPELPMPDAPVLAIDNARTYENMQQSYAAGYEPEIQGDYAVVVLPLVCESGDAPDSVRVSLDLGGGSSPFVVKNYEQTVPLASHPAEDGSINLCYLAEFWLAMRGDRINGSYPVQMQVQGGENYTVYVNISDGIDPDAKDDEPVMTETQPPEDPVVLMPKLLVQTVAGNNVQAGGETELRITLLNTSRTQALENLTVTAVLPEQFTSDDASDTHYHAQVAAGASWEEVFRCRTSAGVPAGTYNIPLQFDYAYGKGMNGSGSAQVRVTVTQPLEMEFPRVILPAEAVVSDRLTLHIQAINLSRCDAGNVRAELDCAGLLPEGTAFIGDVAGGTSGAVDLNVQVSTKSGGELYGETAGKLTFRYNAADGTEYTFEQPVKITLKSPFSERRSEPEQASPLWWIGIMGVIGGGIVLLCAVLILRAKRRGRT